MSSIGDYDTDLFVPHLKGIDFVGRMGGDDEDVPPWNLRRFVRTIQQMANSTATAVVNEVPGQPHWWGGVVDDAYMQAFIASHLYIGPPSLPLSFEVVSMGLWSEGR
jgi:hypothetical protein